MPKTYQPIATATVSGSTTNKITFSSIPGTYTDLVLISLARSAIAQTNDFLFMQPNGDTASNKSFTRFIGDGSSVVTARTSNDAYLQWGQVTGSLTASGIFAVSIGHIMNYANTTTNKSIIARADLGTQSAMAFAGLWSSTSAITSLDIYAGGLNNYVAGSTFSLYGIKAA